MTLEYRGNLRMGEGRPRVLYITGLNEAAVQGSLGHPGRLMRKVFSPLWFGPGGEVWSEREVSWAAVRRKVSLGRK
jgi:hypothetical protein